MGAALLLCKGFGTYLQGQWCLLLFFSTKEEIIHTPGIMKMLENDPPDERFLVEDELCNRGDYAHARV